MIEDRKEVAERARHEPSGFLNPAGIHGALTSQQEMGSRMSKASQWMSEKGGGIDGRIYTSAGVPTNGT